MGKSVKADMAEMMKEEKAEMPMKKKHGGNKLAKPKC